MTEDEAYEKALLELQSKELSTGIWAKAIAFSDGDEKKSESNYIKFRAEQLCNKERKNQRELKTELAFDSARTFLAKIVPVLFSPIGKLNRLSFLLVALGAAFTFAVCIALIDSASQELISILTLPFFFAGGWALICAHLKRAKDIGISSSLAPWIVFFYCALPIARINGPTELNILHTLLFFAFLFAPSKRSNQSG